MLRTLKWLTAISTISALSLSLGTAQGASAEFNPVRAHAVSIGPEAHRLIVGFKANAANAANTARQPQGVGQSEVSGSPQLPVQAKTTSADVTALTRRVGLNLGKSRQITSSMHVLFLNKTVYGADVETTLNQLRADPAVAFAVVDQRRFAHALAPGQIPVTPNDPLFKPTAGATGQWYLGTPSSLPNGDVSAVDAVSAWTITTGITGVVIADVDTGVRFDHPDLGRAQFGGSLLPGYDFVDQDLDSTGKPLGTFLTANDGDGWDPDASDPGDWVSATDLTNPLFPPATCGDTHKPPNYPDKHLDSSWHGTRVAGVLGALTDNSMGIAGVTWANYILPVRALGKCGGYDSDIIAGMQWAAGVPVSGVVNNPYPAKIINLSLGGSPPCSASIYQPVIDILLAKGVLVVVSAGNGGTPGQLAPVDTPGDCTGVLTVAGLRSVGTKVGYSNFGPEVAVSAPAGNCGNSPTGSCLKPIDTTTNLGLTAPGINGYTNQSNPSLGTSFSAPIVAGIAGLMRSVNANLTPSQLISRIQKGALAFPPNTSGLLVCPSNDDKSGECACPPSGQCGAGMANALGAVQLALAPIAAVIPPVSVSPNGTATFDASGSAASCGRTILSTGYAWTASGGFSVTQPATSPQVTVTVGNPATGTVMLTVTDNQSATDSVTLNYMNGVLTGPAPPVNAGTSASACPAGLAITPAAPTVAAAFSPASVDENSVSTLTLTLGNSNPYALTEVSLSDSLPASLTVPPTPLPNSNCAGAKILLSTGNGVVTMSGAIIPAASSCTVTVPVVSATAGTYAYTVAINDLLTGPGGGNAVATTATLTVTTPRKSGGGALGWPELLFAAGLLGATQLRRAARRSS